MPCGLAERNLTESRQEVWTIGLLATGASYYNKTTTLKLNINDIGAKTFGKAHVPNLEAMEHLTIVNQVGPITRGVLTDWGVSFICEAFISRATGRLTLTPLNFVEISSDYIGDDCAGAVCDLVARYKVHSLKLSGKFGDATAATFADRLLSKVNWPLALELVAGDMTNEGVDVLCTAIELCPTVTSFKLTAPKRGTSGGTRIKIMQTILTGRASAVSTRDPGSWTPQEVCTLLIQRNIRAPDVISHVLDNGIDGAKIVSFGEDADGAFYGSFPIQQRALVRKTFFDHFGIEKRDRSGKTSDSLKAMFDMLTHIDAKMSDSESSKVIESLNQIKVMIDQVPTKVADEAADSLEDLSGNLQGIAQGTRTLAEYNKAEVKLLAKLIQMLEEQHISVHPEVLERFKANQLDDASEKEKKGPAKD